MTTVKNPVEWSWAQLGHAAKALGSAGRSLGHIQDTLHSPAPAVRRISAADVMDALAKGFDDFGAYRTDVIFLCVIYPILGVVLGYAVSTAELFPFLFPLASGFALVGPFAAIGLYEMSRRREQGIPVNWANAFDVLRAPALGGIWVLGLLLITIFLAWIAAAWAIYMLTLGPEMPSSIGSFLHDVFATEAGWMMIGIGVAVGFAFALLAMSLSIVSFPLLLDRDVGLDTAVGTSIRAVAANPWTMALWGLIVTSALVIGSIPLFVGLIVVLPVLGHSTWHLYRKLIRH